jgi:hypothetical protein
LRFDKVNQWLTLVANFAVIAGIIFLGIELQQNNKLLQAEAISSVMDTRMIRQDQVIENDSLSELISKNRKREELSDAELLRIRALHTRSMLGWQKDFFLYKEGILTEEYFRTNLQVMKNAFSRDNETFGHLQHWESYWHRAAMPAFRDYIEKCIILDCEDFPN